MALAPAGTTFEDRDFAVLDYLGPEEIHDLDATIGYFGQTAQEHKINQLWLLTTLASHPRSLVTHSKPLVRAFVAKYVGGPLQLSMQEAFDIPKRTEPSSQVSPTQPFCLPAPISPTQPFSLPAADAEMEPGGGTQSEEDDARLLQARQRRERDRAASQEEDAFLLQAAEQYEAARAAGQ